MASELIWAAVGGLLIGASALLVLAVNGRIAGVSGVVGGLMQAPPAGDRVWRIGFLVGIFVGGLLLLIAAPQTLPGVSAPWPWVILGGLLVGFGARQGNGCTSGHGVCGLGRRSRRSLVAVLVFMSAGVLAAQLLRPLLGVPS